MRGDSNKETTTMKISPTAAFGTRSLCRRTLSLVCALTACMAVAPSLSGAAVVHNHEGSFTGSETPNGSVGLVLALAVDNTGGPSSGDLYVGGATGFGGPGYVYKFNSSGQYAGVELKGSETTQGSFSFLDFSNYEVSRGLAVDGSNGAHKGDVYLADAEHDVIDRFSEEGKFLCEITGKEYASLSAAEQEHECAGAAGSKTPQDGLHVAEYSFTVLGLAVDPQNGDVYVSSPADKAIDEFNEAGEYIGQIEGSHITAPGPLAFDSSGELYVTNGAFFGGEDVVKLDSSGAFLSTLDESAPQSVAVNLADGRTYVSESSEEQTAEYDSTGKLVSTFGKEQNGALAVNNATGRIYTAPVFGRTVYMYGKAFVIPNVTTGAASEVKEMSAILHGDAEPDPNGGAVTACQFEYASEYTLHHIQTISARTTFAPGRFRLSFDGQSTGWSGEGKLAPESTTVTEVTQLEGYNGLPVANEEIYGSGIRNGTKVVSYNTQTHELVLSQATEETVPGSSTSLNTDIPADAQSETIKDALEALSPPQGSIPTQKIGSGDIAVSGPAGGPWTVEFTGSLGSAVVPLLEMEPVGFSVEASVEGNWQGASKIPCEPAAPYSEAKPVSAQVSGLAASTNYQYRVMAADSEGPATGEAKSFTTYGAPAVDRESAEALQTSADLRAHVNPFGYDTTCQVQYVDEASFQQSQWTNATTLPCQPEDLGAGFGDVTAKVKVHGLARAAAYRYRFMATNRAGVTAASGGTFETYGIRQLSMEFVKSAITSFAGGSEIWQAGELEPPQAGAHPYELVTTVTFTHTTEFSSCASSYEQYTSLGCPGEIEIAGNTAVNTKDIKVDLPPGVIGNPTSLPKCSRYLVQLTECPPDTQVGAIEVWVDYPLGRGNRWWPVPEEYETEEQTGRRYITGIYNVEPAGPHPAEFAGFIEGEAPAWIPFEVRTGSDYGVTANSIDLTDVGGGISRVRTRVWGVPADPLHTAERRCPESAHGSCTDTEPEVPLLTDPTSCAGPLSVTASSDSWQEPGQYVSKKIEMPAFTGCDKLQFEPSFEAQPTTAEADSPSGLHLDLHVPQDLNGEGHEDPHGLATADLRNTKIVLPAGVTVDPSSADGLQACSETQIGYLAQRSAEAGKPQFTPGPAQCPDASKIGKVEVDSPLLDHPLPGAVYVASQGANPFKSLLAVYVTVYDAQTGVVIKLPGEVSLDPVTGQLTTTVDEDPQLPFTDFKVDLFSGSRAALTTPLACGSYTTLTDLTPWSSPEGADATPSSLPFTVSGAPGGAACVQSEAQAPNTPGFEAGSASPVGGSYSPFVLHLKREDASQHFGALDVTLPPGLTGKVAGLQECSQAAIEAAQSRSREGDGALEMAHPSCPTGSEVGTVHVGVGSGAPYYQTGHAYFAGPYKGAPFSIVFVTPAVAGPFDLGTVVVRAALYIDPSTAQVTVKSDPFPTILYGIPLDIRSVNVAMTRKEFVLNPTSCEVMSVTGQESSTAGQAVALSDRFQAGGCTTLPFHPSFTASTLATHSRQNGESLHVTVRSQPGQANIKSVHVVVPRQLPARLPTLNLACPEAQFAADPSHCPAGSFVGTATAQTPILPVPLTGPAIFVSHGGAEFPDLDLVLQGDGVTVILRGATHIDKAGTVTSTFSTVPDVPVTRFDLDLPEGPHSALAAPRGVCGSALTMPTIITGQNGAQVTQATPVAAAGCKPEIRVVRRAVKGHSVRLTVSVPAAGKLLATGTGLSRASRKLGKAGQATLRLTLTSKQRQFLARHRGRRLKVHVKLVFTPVHGSRITAVVTMLVG